jgi:hypothetical protein
VVEIEPSGAVWVKSSASSGDANNCVELSLGDVVMIRDSHDPYGSRLSFSAQAWQTFLGRRSA